MIPSGMIPIDAAKPIAAQAITILSIFSSHHPILSYIDMIYFIYHSLYTFRDGMSN